MVWECSLSCWEEHSADCWQGITSGMSAKTEGRRCSHCPHRSCSIRMEGGRRTMEIWGSRIIKATLGGGSRKTSHLHILSCYAPIFAASRAEKDNFFNYLQEAVDEIPPNETYVILGDFNTHVGSRDPAKEDYWGKSSGPHGFGKMNDAGKERLSFLSLNEATVCNTLFQKNDIYKCTWQHPKSKSWHCIDYAIVRARDRRRCLDASVKRGAECNTDHQLLRIKLHMSKLYQTAKTTTSPHRFDISKLVGPSSDKDGKNTPRGQFQELVKKSAKE